MAAENSAGSAGKQRRGRPFVKGQSGNPGGRPKGIVQRVKALGGEDGRDYLAILDEIARGNMTVAVVVDGKVEQIGPSFKDRRECAVALLDRGFGKPSNPVELSGEGGGPLVVQVVKYSDTERE